MRVTREWEDVASRYSGRGGFQPAQNERECQGSRPGTIVAEQRAHQCPVCDDIEGNEDNLQEAPNHLHSPPPRELEYIPLEA